MRTRRPEIDPICRSRLQRLCAAIAVSILIPIAGPTAHASETQDEANLREPTRAFWRDVGVAVQKGRDCGLPPSRMQQTLTFRRLQQTLLDVYAEVSSRPADLATPDDIREAFGEGEDEQRRSLPPTDAECEQIGRGWVAREANAAVINDVLHSMFARPDQTSQPTSTR